MQNAYLARLYENQWDEAVTRALQKLSEFNAKRLDTQRDAESIHKQLQALRQLERLQPAKYAITVLECSLKHFEVSQELFTKNFPDLKTHRLFWGMFYLMVQELSKDGVPPASISLVASMIKNLGHKTGLLNQYLGVHTNSEQMLDAQLDVHSELLNFIPSAIKFFERGNSKMQGNDVRNILNQAYENSAQEIGHVFERVKELLQLTKSAAIASELHNQEILMSAPAGGNEEEAVLPCSSTLPVSQNALFYDRDSIIARIDAVFFPSSGEQVFRSLVLYGIGGVGKSQVALKYTRIKIIKRELDAVFWLNSEKEIDLASSFTEAALALGLPRASKERHGENRVLLLNWLQRTSAKWLLIFDNANEPDLLLRYWPSACAHGSVLVTSRNHNLRYGLAEDGIEVPHFDPDDGSKMLLHLLRMDAIQDISSTEIDSALELSQQLAGHALALSFIAGFIQQRSWTIREFHEEYENNRQEYHFPRQESNALTAIWQLTFKSLDKTAATILGVLAYLHPDQVPEDMLMRLQSDTSLRSLKDFSDAMVPLFTLALVKRDKNKRSLSMHRLVQIQYRYFITISERQKSFDAAVRLLLDGFGAVTSQLWDRWATCYTYLQQILAVRDKYTEECNVADSVKPTLEFCELLRNCSRFLLEIADLTELEKTLMITMSAFDALTPQEKHDGIRLLSKVRSVLSDLWTARGQQSKGLEEMMEAYRLEESCIPQDLLMLTWRENACANHMASVGRYEEALQWLLRCEKRRANIRPVPEDVIKMEGVVHQNIARCYSFTNQPHEAIERIQMSVKLLEASENWAMLAFTFFVHGNLHRRQGELHAAKSMFMKTQQTWLEGSKQQGTELRTHHFNGACLYKLGCVANDLGQIDEAVTYLREALRISTLKGMLMPGEHLRSLFKLAQVLRKRSETIVEASDLELELIRLNGMRKLSLQSTKSSEMGSGICTPAYTASVSENDNRRQEEEEESSYDDLVGTLWR